MSTKNPEDFSMSGYEIHLRKFAVDPLSDIKFMMISGEAMSDIAGDNWNIFEQINKKLVTLKRRNIRVTEPNLHVYAEYFYQDEKTLKLEDDAVRAVLHLLQIAGVPKFQAQLHVELYSKGKDETTKRRFVKSLGEIYGEQ